MSWVVKKIYFLLLLLALCASIQSCDKDQDYDKSKAILAYAQDSSLEIDDKLKNQIISLPSLKNNHSFNGSHSLLNQDNENIEKNFQPFAKSFFNKTNQYKINRSWSSSHFYASTSEENFYFEPIISQQKIYFLDPSGELFAYDLITKKKIWQSQIFNKPSIQNFRVAQITLADNVIYATIGSNYLVAVNAQDGKIIWQKQVSALLISKPIVSNNLIYVVSDNNRLYCFKSNNAELKFTHNGVNRSTAILGSSPPVIYGDKLLVAYSSGEIYALNKINGEVIWTHDLNLNKAINSDFYLNDIDANILVKNEVAYAIGNGGLMKAINIKNGALIFKKQIAGIANFWLAKDYIYVINNDNKLLAINRLSGGIKWFKQLPAYKNPKKLASKFFYFTINNLFS